MKDEGKPRDIHDRLMEFALEILRMHEELPNNRAAREARRARSTAEFVSKCESSQQEMDETTFWLELIERAAWLPATRMFGLRQEADELVRILASMAINAKKHA